MKLDDTIQQSFGTAASRYAESPVHRGGPDLDAMLRVAAITPGCRAVDVACGAGHTALALARAGARVTATDLTPAMLETTRKAAAAAGLSLEVQPAPAHALALEDRSVRLITCRVAAHHFADLAAFIGEAARVLEPGGQLIVSDCVAPPAPVADTFLQTIELLRDPSHVRDRTVGEWQRNFEAAGFRFSCVLTTSFRLDLPSWFERMGTPEDRAHMVRDLLRQAPEEVCEALALELDAFHIPVAVMAGTLRA